MNRPAFIVHDLDQARAVAAAAEESGRPILLLTPPDSAAALGVLWLRELARHLRREHPLADVLAVLDCGDRAALAHEALRAGAEAVYFTGPEEQAGALAEVAAALGSTVLRDRPAALDLGSVPPKRRVEAAKTWIGNPEARPNVDQREPSGDSARH